MSGNTVVATVPGPVPATHPVTIAELARLTREAPFERKLLVCRTPAQGRELLRALASAGVPWIGWEATTVRQLAHEIAVVDLARRGLSVADEFDLLSLADEAIDTVRERGRAGPFDRVAGVAGYRDAIRYAIGALRDAGLGPGDLRARCRPDDTKLAAVAEILAEYEAGLDRARKVDAAGIFRHAVAAIDEGRATLPAARLYLAAGHTLRGLAGRFTRRLLEVGRATIVDADRAEGLEPPTAELWPEARAGDPQGQAEVALFAAATPVDELREVLRRVVENGIPWDQVEIVATDPVTYGATLDGLARRLGIPVTYAAGLDNRRTRVGRAVQAYFRWITEGFPADLIRALLEAGDLAPVDADGVSGVALARRIRRLRIGWGYDRYRTVIESAHAAARTTAPATGDEQDDADAQRARDRELRELEALLGLLGPVLEATPRPPDQGRGTGGRTSPAAVARGLLRFLEYVPTGDAVENTARKVIRDRLERAEQALRRETGWDAAVAILRSRLETRIATGDEGGPAPWTSTGGRLHLSDLRTGGLACRPYTFVVGLDAGRTAGSGGPDPILTDADRQRLNLGTVDPVPPLPTTADRIQEARHELATVLARLRGRVTLSYSAWDMAEGRAISPAAELLQALRRQRNDDALTYEDLRIALGPLACAVPRGTGRIDAADVWLAELADGKVLRQGTEVVRSVFPGLDHGLTAVEHRAGEEVTEYHGRIEPMPELDPRSSAGAVFSATQLETLGTCPRRFFYRYVLGLVPIRDPEWDPESWLDALERGSLLHTVYERTLAGAREGAIDYDAREFEALALTILDQEIERVRKRCPEPGQAVYEAEVDALREDVRAFVEMIREQRPDWNALELRFGPGKREVTIPVGGAPVRVRGAIDRVDEVAPGRLRIVDYKTGGSSRFKRSRPFNGGRRIQHVIYTLAAERLLDATVEAMEYHFPTRRGQNDSVPYPVDRLRRGGEVLETLFAIAAEGLYVATDDVDDCKFCDFADICRAMTDDFGNVSCKEAAWARSVGRELPEYEPLMRLRGIDE